jgi:2'-5' RNA ligase
VLRVFIGLELPCDIRRRLSEFQSRFPSLEVKWVEEENLHVTLLFLGSIAPNKIFALRSCSEIAAGKIEPFTYEIRGLGKFPAHGNPRTIWAGIDNGRVNLNRLYNSLAEALLGAGFNIKKGNYIPHVTIGRLRAPGNLTKVFQQYEKTLFGVHYAKEFSIINSTLTPRGPVYTTLHRISLPEK